MISGYLSKAPDIHISINGSLSGNLILLPFAFEGGSDY